MNYTFQLKGQKPNKNHLPELDIMLLRENIREYDRIVDDIVRRSKEQERIVKEWDREMERQKDLQYRFMFDDVIREFQFLLYCASIRI